MQKFIYWTPRILSIFFILFLMMFSLDIFEEQSGFWQILVGFFIHNIPAFVLTIILIISWRYEIVGTVGYILAGMLYITLLILNSIQHGFQIYTISFAIIIAGPPFLVGILFLFSWLNRKKKSNISH